MLIPKKIMKMKRQLIMLKYLLQFLVRRQIAPLSHQNSTIRLKVKLSSLEKTQV
jgi:hypothetical protein